MKRGWLGLGILVFFLVLGLTVGSWMDRCHASTGQWLEEAAEKTLSGDWEAGTALAEDAKQKWQQQWRYTAIVADHTPMEEIDALFAEMEVYSRCQEMPHFVACCKELAQQITAVAQAHTFSWWNIL